MDEKGILYKVHHCMDGLPESNSGIEIDDLYECHCNKWWKCINKSNNETQWKPIKEKNARKILKKIADLK